MISIVIPLYNKAAVICRTMESVKQQIFSDFEILIVNDGSTDDSLSVLMDFLSENEAVFKNSVRLIEQENKGVSAARNQGIKEARGEIIAFLDADDEWLPDYLKTIAFLVEKYPECDIFGTAYSFKMNKKEKIKKYRESVQVEANEEKIQETIYKSKNVFFMAEQERMLSYHDFLWTQLRVIQKRWWVLQFMILVALWIALSSIHDEIYLKRSMGVVATLFVILIIPELWKNRSCECMEIEATSYYSLKQVYATRMLLFGVTDIFLITVFLGVVSAGLHYELSELVVQFLFPLCVTACICFGILCSKHSFGETVAIVLCVIWSAVWLFIVLNENVYIMVTVPIWSALLGATILFIAFAIYRVLKNCNQYLEVSFDEIRA